MRSWGFEGRFRPGSDGKHSGEARLGIFTAISEFGQVNGADVTIKIESVVAAQPRLEKSREVVEANRRFRNREHHLVAFCHPYCASPVEIPRARAKRGMNFPAAYEERPGLASDTWVGIQPGKQRGLDNGRGPICHIEDAVGLHVEI